MREQDRSEIKQLLEDYQYANEMPDSVEKHLIQLYLHFQILVISKEEQVQVPDLTPVLENLKSRLAIEAFPANNKLFSLLPGLENGSLTPKKIASSLAEILKEIQPVNVAMLLRLLDDTQAAAEKIKDKKIIALFGLTGSGKSTSLHYFAGAKMKVVEEEEGLPRVEYSYEDLEDELLDEELGNVQIGHTKTNSQTRHIHPITINYTAEDTQKSILICDIPGFQDSNGAERDIANGTKLVDAMQQSGSVKPVIVLSLMSIGDKAQGLGHLLSTLIKFMPDLKNKLNTISFVFTKTGNLSQTGIHNNLKAVLDELPSTVDENLEALMQHMVNETAPGKTVNILKFSANEEVAAEKRIALLEQFAQAPALSEPSTDFQYFAAAESKDKLMLKLGQYHKRIKGALERGEFALLNYELNELSKLNKHLNSRFAEISTAYQEILGTVKSHIETLSADVTISYQTLLSGNFQWENNAELIAKTIKDVKNLIQLESIREACLSDSLPNSLVSLCVEPIKAAQTKLFDELKVEDNIQAIVSKIKNIEGIAKFAACLGDAESAELTQIHQQAIAFLTEGFENMLAQAQQAIDDIDFNRFEVLMTKASGINTACGELLKNGSERIEEIKKSCGKMLDNKIRNAFNYLRAKDQNAPDSKIVAQAIALFNAIKAANDNIYNYIGVDKSKFPLLSESLTTAKLGYFIVIKKEIQRYLDTHISQLKPPSEKSINSLAIMRGMLVSGDSTDKLYKELVAYIQKVVSKLKEGVTESLRTLRAEQSYDVYSEYLRRLYDIESLLLDDEKQGAFDTAKKEILSYVVADNYAYSAAEKIHALVKNDCADILPELVTIQQEIISAMNDKVRTALSNAMSHVPHVTELNLQAAIVEDALVSLTETKKTDLPSNKSFLIASKARIDTVVSELKALRKLLLTLAQQNIGSPFVSLPELLEYRMVGEALTVDGFLYYNDSFVSATKDIVSLYASERQTLQGIINGYYNAERYSQERYGHAIFVNKSFGLTLVFNSINVPAPVELNLTHAQKYIPKEIVTNLHVLSGKISEIGLVDQADKLAEFIFNQLNLILEQIKGCEYAEAKRHHDSISALVDQLYDTPENRRINYLQDNLVAVGKVIASIGQEEDSAFEASKKSYNSMIALMKQSHDEYKFIFSAKVKLEIDTGILRPIDRLRETSAHTISASGGVAKLIDELRNVFRLYQHYTTTLEQFHQFDTVPEHIKRNFRSYKKEDFSIDYVMSGYRSMIQTIEGNLSASLDLLTNVATINPMSFEHFKVLHFFCIDNRHEFESFLMDVPNSLHILSKRLLLDSLGHSRTSKNVLLNC